MKISKRWLWMIGLSSLALLSGCGSGPSGTWAVTESGLSSSCTQTNLSINESGSSVTGSGSNSCYSQSLVGTDSGGGSMTGVTLTLNPISTSSPYGSYGSPYGTQSCNYIGSLNYGNNQLSGTLTLENSSSVSNYCPSSITLTGTETSS